MGAIRPGGSGGASSVAAADITDAGAVGVDLVQSAALADAVTALGGAAAVRTALSTGQTDSDTPQLTSSTGWTITAMAAGAGAIAGGAFTATIPVGTTIYTGAYATRAWPRADSIAWEIQGRVEITNDTDGELLGGLSVVWTDGGYTVYLRGSGGLYVYREGGWGFATQIVVGSGLPLDGTLWLRWRGEGTRLRLYTGIGSGSTAPTTWTLASDFSDVEILGSRSVPDELRLYGFSGNTHSVPSGTTIAWRSLTVRSFDP